MRVVPSPEPGEAGPEAALQALLEALKLALARGDLAAARSMAQDAYARFPGADSGQALAHLLLISGEAAAAAEIFADLQTGLAPGPEAQAFAVAELFCNYCDGDTEADELRERLDRFAAVNRREIGALAMPALRRQPLVAFLHPACYFHPASLLLRMLLAQASTRFETLVFGLLPAQADFITGDLQALADGFHWLPAGYQAAAVRARAERIRALSPDVLIDMSGFSSLSQIPVLLQKPAPLQLTGLGLPFATGLDCFDACFSDAATQAARWPGLELQPGAAGLEPVLLIGSWICWQPPHQAPPLRVPEGRAFTFGSPHALAKLHPGLLADWAELLAACPGSRLRFKLPFAGDARIQARLRAPFADQGIEPERIEIEPAGPYFDYLDFYNRIDCVLDSAPYPGGTTSCEALWMGVPVLVGQGRHGGGYSLLTQIGHPEWFCPDQSSLRQAARDLYAAGPRALSARERLRAESLRAIAFQPAAWARSFEQGLIDFCA